MAEIVVSGWGEERYSLFSRVMTGVDARGQIFGDGLYIVGFIEVIGEEFGGDGCGGSIEGKSLTYLQYSLKTTQNRICLKKLPSEPIPLARPLL